MNYLALTGLINFITCAGLGVFVIIKNSKKLPNIAYFCLNASVALFSVGYFFWQMSTSRELAIFWFKILFVGIALINLSYLFFVFAFLNIIKSQRWLLSACALLNIFFIGSSFNGNLYLDFVNKFNYGLWPVPTYLFNYYLGFWVLQCLYGFYFLVKNLQSTSLRRRMQVRYFTIAAIVGFFGGATNWPMWYGIKILPYANILISLYIAIVAYAIVKHQLMDIEVIIKKTIVFAGLFLAAYTILVSFAYLGSTFFENIIHSRWLAMGPSVLVIVLILRPLEAFLRSTTDKYLFQKKYDYKELLKTFTGEVLTVLDLNELVNTTVQKLSDILKLENTSIFLNDEEAGEFRLIATTGKLKNSYKISSEEALIGFLHERSFLVNNSYSGDGYQGRVLKAMEEFGGELVMPLLHHNSMIGILSFGKKKSDEEFTQDDIDILTALSKTLSIAIANALLFEKLSQAQAQAAQREKMAVIGTLSAGINHEICNPLGIARGQCEMFLLNLEEGVYKGKTPEELIEKASSIMKKVINETDRATTITKKLSSFAKPPKGSLEDDVNLEKELNEVIALVEHDLKLDNILIVKEIEKRLPLIAVDRKQIQEIFFNIIRNAVQAINDSGTITIRARREADKVVIDVQDSGRGMDKKELSQVFNPFYTTKEPGKGTGLGLFIVRQIANKNKGTVEVKSEPGEGTTVTLTFTVSRKKKEGAENQKQPVEERNI